MEAAARMSAVLAGVGDQNAISSGDIVEITGLTNAIHLKLNGRRGEVLRRKPDDARRLVVQLVDTGDDEEAKGEVYVKESNLICLGRHELYFTFDAQDTLTCTGHGREAGRGLPLHLSIVTLVPISAQPEARLCH